VHGAVHKYQGQVSVFNYQNGPSYRCLHPQSSTENPETPGELGIFSVLPGIIGLLQVNEALKVVTGAGEVLSGKLMIYNALNSQFVLVDIEKNPDNFITKNLITKFS
jgi:adenylyltransferase/sulfurtransferase